MLIFGALPIQWRYPVAGVVLVTLVCVGAFFSTWASIVEIWSRSETFTHGFLVAPISLWLIWSRRHCYRNLQPESAWMGLLVTAIGGFVWLVAKLVHVLVLEQWAVVTILIGGYWGLLGGSVIKKMLFPILFLYLMVPFGEAFIPWMMEYTASFVVWMIRLTGMSVYRDGMFFMLTSGNWSVVEGCSGLRYLIASLTLGLVYAYLNFRNLRKRTLFIIASFLTPILANGLRAYMIVMIGHFSGMKLAVGVDHIIYGWLFFGLVMLLLFYAGSFWADQETIVDTSSEQSMPEPMTRYQGLLPMIAVVVIGLIAWPIVFRSLAARQAVAAAIPDQIVTLRGSGGAVQSPPDWGWRPTFNGVMAEVKNAVDDPSGTVAMYFANFGDESQGGELVNSQNFLVPQKHKVWRMASERAVQVDWPDGTSGEVVESLLKSEARNLLVYRWYRVGNFNTASDYRAKWWQLLKRLTGDADPEMLIVLYTEVIGDDLVEGRARLQRVLAVCCQ